MYRPKAPVAPNTVAVWPVPSQKESREIGQQAIVFVPPSEDLFNQVSSRDYQGNLDKHYHLPATLRTDDGLASASDGDIREAPALDGAPGDFLGRPQGGRQGSHSCRERIASRALAFAIGVEKSSGSC